MTTKLLQRVMKAGGGGLTSNGPFEPLYKGVSALWNV